MAKRKVSYEHYHFIKWILILAGIATFGFLLLKIVNFFISISNYGLIKRPDNMYQTEYSNDKNGYSISYPKDFTRDTSAGVPADIIKNSDDTVRIAIQRLVGDQRMLTLHGVTATMKEMKDAYRLDKNYTLDMFEGTTWKGLPALQVRGTFTENGISWNFEEYTIFFGSEIYNLRVNAKKDAQYDQDAVQSSIDSFKLNGYDSREDEEANKALADVMYFPEVKKFQYDVFGNNQSKFSVYVDSSPSPQEPYYTVVVAEFFPDHRTTFNRYRVDLKNKDVFRYDVVNDTWDRL
ncbi:hypothetical protein HY407_02925 [Candidatus Gottesmanbacteria bacterium]|nr:hypothetical protein [Candidatus Gottesmanbacteria bacterium]